MSDSLASLIHVIAVILQEVLANLRTRERLVIRISGKATYPFPVLDQFNHPEPNWNQLSQFWMSSQGKQSDLLAKFQLFSDLESKQTFALYEGMSYLGSFFQVGYAFKEGKLVFLGNENYEVEFDKLYDWLWS